MKLLIAVLAALMVGCTTVSEKTIEYCDTDSRKFIGITVSTSSDCIGLSNSESGREINIPINPE